MLIMLGCLAACGPAPAALAPQPTVPPHPTERAVLATEIATATGDCFASFSILEHALQADAAGSGVANAVPDAANVALDVCDETAPALIVVPLALGQERAVQRAVGALGDDLVAVHHLALAAHSLRGEGDAAAVLRPLTAEVLRTRLRLAHDRDQLRALGLLPSA